MKEEKLVIKGIIDKIFQRHQFSVKLQNGSHIFGILSGKMCEHKIWCQVGDEVEVELSIYDLSKGRIIKRL